jgi:hypothetical protein
MSGFAVFSVVLPIAALRFATEASATQNATVDDIPCGTRLRDSACASHADPLKVVSVMFKNDEPSEAAANEIRE